MTTRHRILALTLLSAAAAGAVWAQAQGRIVGTVLDETGTPLEGVQVTLNIQNSSFEMKQKTNKKGKFTLTVVDSTKNYFVRLAHEGYMPVSEAVDPQSGTTVSKTWRLQPVDAAGSTSGTPGVPGIATGMPVGADLAGKITSDSRDAIRAYNQGRTAVQEGDVATAIEQFDIAVSFDPTLGDVLAVLSELQFQEGMNEAAIATAEKLLALDAENATALSVRYDGLIVLERTDEALEGLDALAVADPTDITAARLHNAGVYLLQKDDKEGAIKRFEQAVAIKADLAQTHSLLGSLYLADKNYEKSLMHAEALLAVDPESAKGMALRYETYRGKGDAAMAEEALAALQAADPERVGEAFYKEGKAHFDAGRTAQAIGALKRSVTADPNHAQAHFQLGLALVGTGDSAAAKQHFERFLALSPDHPEAGTASEMLKYLGD